MPKKIRVHPSFNQKTFAALPADERVRLLNRHILSGDYAVGEDIYCLHCDRSFKAETVKVDERMSWEFGDYYFECPNDCNGSPLDWSSRPWWRGDEPEEEL